MIEYRLTIDVGNTKTKIGIFQSNQLIHTESFKQLTVSKLKQISAKFPFQKSIITNSGNYDVQSIDEELSKSSLFLKFDHKTPIPIVNKYATPKTLGKDRLCSIIGASAQSGLCKNILVIDTGTCITFNFLSDKNEYLGGSISPGIDMRFKAMPAFTFALPLVDYDYTPTELIGNTTDTSITSGIVNGIIAEIDGMIENYRNKYGALDVFMTGGGSKFFEKQMKNKIFAIPNLVLYGLNKILEHNAAK